VGLEALLAQYCEDGTAANTTVAEAFLALALPWKEWYQDSLVQNKNYNVWTKTNLKTWVLRF
jgi:hypothetical protein